MGNKRKFGSEKAKRLEFFIQESSVNKRGSRILYQSGPQNFEKG